MLLSSLLLSLLLLLLLLLLYVCYYFVRLIIVLLYIYLYIYIFIYTCIYVYMYTHAFFVTQRASNDHTSFGWGRIPKTQGATSSDTYGAEMVITLVSRFITSVSQRVRHVCSGSLGLPVPPECQPQLRLRLWQTLSLDMVASLCEGTCVSVVLIGNRKNNHPYWRCIRAWKKGVRYPLVPGFTLRSEAQSFLSLREPHLLQRGCS